MRWLFLVALFLNLAYMTWQILMPATDLYADIPVLKNVESIVLLAELKQKKETDSVSAAVDLLQKPVELEAEAETVSVEGLISDQTGIERQDVAEEIITETKDDAVIVLKESVLTEVSQAKPAEGESCFTLGPFRDLDKLRSFMREIKPYVVKADFRGQEESRLSVYWVYLRPEKNRKQAIKTGQRLKDKKIKDFYIIREGERNNGISLGYFRNKNRAFRLEKKVKKLGFDVLVEPIYKTYTLYWLDYQLVGGADIPEAIIEKYSQSTKTDKTSWLSRDCGV
jgi:hypothetical protein